MTIDLTARYHTPQYQRAGIDWTIDRDDEPVVALLIHHSAGWYVAVLDENATEAQEIAELDALALDHFLRFGIGPGYYYAAFPSGRLYAIGKYGTHRAHVKGRNPATQNLWNRESMAIVAMGDYETNPMPIGLKRAIAEGVAEVGAIVGQRPIAIHPHGQTPGNPTRTSCPGRYIEEWMGARLPLAPHDHADLRHEIETAQAALDRAMELLEAQG